MSCDYCLDLFEGISVNVASYYKIEEITDFVMANWQVSEIVLLNFVYLFQA